MSTTEVKPKSIMSDKEFYRLSDIIDRELGIKMPFTKKIMLESRLQKRLRILELRDFTEYIDFLIDSNRNQAEMVEFRNMVTTNKTDFFRENNHFEFLNKNLLPRWYKEGKKKIKVWSCACSSGEEPYTLAIVLEEFKRLNSEFEYSITATDISTRVLGKAKEGIYTEADVSVIKPELKKRYFLKGTGDKKSLYRIKDFLKERITFGRFNLMSNKYSSVPGPSDCIFCRNVLIYFDRDRQEEIISKLLGQMSRDGVLFLGHSESMAGMNLKLKALASSVYTRDNR